MANNSPSGRCIFYGLLHDRVVAVVSSLKGSISFEAKGAAHNTSQRCE